MIGWLTLQSLGGIGLAQDVVERNGTKQSIATIAMNHLTKEKVGQLMTVKTQHVQLVRNGQMQNPLKIVRKDTSEVTKDSKFQSRKDRLKIGYWYFKLMGGNVLAAVTTMLGKKLEGFHFYRLTILTAEGEDTLLKLGDFT